MTGTDVGTETERRELAARAASQEEDQAAIKRAIEALRSHQAAEKARAAAAMVQEKALQKELDKARAKASASSGAAEKLRTRFVPFDLRQRLSAAGRAEREALSVLRRSESDLAKAREGLERVRARVKGIPSEAAPRDLLEMIRHEEALLAQFEATASFAAEAHERAKAEHAEVRALYDAAMAAARKL